MKEAELQKEVLALCSKYGVLVFHSGNAKQDTGKGYPDLTLCSRNGVMWAELKSWTGTVHDEQIKWKWALKAAGARWETWTPRDLASGLIEATLKELSAPEGSVNDPAKDVTDRTFARSMNAGVPVIPVKKPRKPSAEKPATEEPTRTSLLGILGAVAKALAG